MSKDTLKFAVVGCGHIGKRHVSVIQKEADARLVAVCDIDPEKMKREDITGNKLETFTDYDLMLAESDFDIICICTPHGLHAEMSIKAAKAKKHVLVEKPMGLNVAESEEMIRVAEENEIRLFVVKQNRFNTPIKLTHKALKENRLGKILMVQCNVMWNRNQAYYQQSSWRGNKESEGGALHTQVSHFIDLMVWWFGNIKESKTIMDTLNHEIEIEDAGVSALRFESGVIGSLFWTTCVYNVNYEGSITIIGEKGTIKIGGKYLNEIEFWDVQSYPLPADQEFDDKPNEYGTYQGSSSNHDQLIHDMIPQIIQNRRGVVEGEEGMKTIKAIEKIYQNA